MRSRPADGNLAEIGEERDPAQLFFDIRVALRYHGSKVVKLVIKWERAISAEKRTT